MPQWSDRLATSQHVESLLTGGKALPNSAICYRLKANIDRPTAGTIRADFLVARRERRAMVDGARNAAARLNAAGYPTQFRWL